MATSVLLSRLLRSSVRASSSPILAWSWLLTVLSSSLSDCSSSLEVSSSSFDACSSSLIERISSFEALSSSLVGLHLLDAEAEILAGRVRSLCSWPSLRASSTSAGRGAPRAPARARGSRPAAGARRRGRDASGATTMRTGCTASPRRTRALTVTSLPSSIALRTAIAQRRLQTLARHRQQIVGRLAGGRPQVVLGRPAQVEHPVARVDQHARRRVALEQRLVHQLAGAQRRIDAPARPRGLRRPGAGADEREIDDLVAGRPEPPEEPPLLGDRPEQLPLAADRLGGAEEQVPALAQREVEQADELAFGSRARDRSAGCGS